MQFVEYEMLDDTLEKYKMAVDFDAETKPETGRYILDHLLS